MTVTASNFARRLHDLYETEPWATEALLRHFPVAGLRIWEPAAGRNAITRVLRGAGATVWASDIFDYGDTLDEVRDFLAPAPPAPVGDAIVTNPPYGQGNRAAVRFAELALERCPGTVALLLTAKFDFGKTRHHLFADNPRFKAKIALTDRISWAGNGETGTEDHAWYLWGPGSHAKPVMVWEGRT